MDRDGWVAMLVGWLLALLKREPESFDEDAWWARQW